MLLYAITAWEEPFATLAISSSSGALGGATGQPSTPGGRISVMSSAIVDMEASLLNAVLEGDKRPVFPPGTLKAVREVARDCWIRSAARRPTLAEVEDALEAALQAHARPLLSSANAEEPTSSHCPPAARRSPCRTAVAPAVNGIWFHACPSATRPP